MAKVKKKKQDKDDASARPRRPSTKQNTSPPSNAATVLATECQPTLTSLLSPHVQSGGQDGLDMPPVQKTRFISLKTSSEAWRRDYRQQLRRRGLDTR